MDFRGSKLTAAPSLVEFKLRRSFDYFDYLSLISSFATSTSDGAVEKSNMAAAREIKYFSNGTKIDERESLLDFRNYIEVVVVSINSPDNCTI